MKKTNRLGHKRKGFGVKFRKDGSMGNVAKTKEFEVSVRKKG